MLKLNHYLKFITKINFGRQKSNIPRKKPTLKKNSSIEVNNRLEEISENEESIPEEIFVPNLNDVDDIKKRVRSMDSG